MMFRSGLTMFFASALLALMPSVARSVSDSPTGYGILLGCFGAGAVLGALTLQPARARWSTEAVASGRRRDPWPDDDRRRLPARDGALAAAMLIAGAAWIVFISLVSALVQSLAPDWVRARVLAVFMLVFQGGLAAGSALWGAVAARAGIQSALLWAGLGIIATAALGLVAKLPDATGDVSPWNHWRMPAIVEDVRPEFDEGPVLVTVEIGSAAIGRGSSSTRCASTAAFGVGTAPSGGASATSRTRPLRRDVPRQLMGRTSSSTRRTTMRIARSRSGCEAVVTGRPRPAPRVCKHPHVERRGKSEAAMSGPPRRTLLSWVHRSRTICDKRRRRSCPRERRTRREMDFKGSGDFNIFFRSWRPPGKARGVVVVIVPRLQLAQRTTTLWVAEQFVTSGLAVYALDLRGRGKSDGERFYVEKFADYVNDLATFVTLAKAREPGLPVFLLGHSAGGVVACVYTLDHQAEIAGLICESFALPGAGAGLRARRAQGPQPRRAARPRAQAQERGLLARSQGRGGDEHRSADRPRGAADADRRGDGARRRAAEEGVSAHHAAGADPARHARQGDQAERQPALLRHGRLHGQDAEALRGPLSRPAQRPRQGGRHGGHQGAWIDAHLPAA